MSDLRPPVLSEYHVVPVGDLVAHDEDGTDCACGPSVRLEPMGMVVVHHSLDGRELSE